MSLKLSIRQAIGAAAFAACLFTSASGQDFSAGLTVGINASQIDGDRQGGYNKAGLSAGGYVARQFTEHWGAALELRLSQKGAKWNPHGDKLSLTYIDVPLMARYSIWEITAEAGLIPGFLAGQKVVDGLMQEFSTRAYRRFSLEAAAGVSYNITRHLWGGIRFAYSALPIASVSGGRITSRQYNNYIAANIGYNF
jgi:opacity protein-like surface antigen